MKVQYEEPAQRYGRSVERYFERAALRRLPVAATARRRARFALAGACFARASMRRRFAPGCTRPSDVLAARRCT
jgi:hypothetical protein